MIKPFKLGYADFDCSDIEEMEDYYLNIMGFSMVEEEGDTKYISSGVDHHNIVLRKGTESALKTIGYQIEETDSLSSVVNELKAYGIKADIKTDSQPGLSELVEFEDPDGYRIQLFHKIESPIPGYKENGISPFKLGHIAIGSLDAKKSTEFYLEVLNFNFTDKIGNRATFLTCNQDHHVLNIASFGQKMMHHIAFELKDASHHTRSADILAKNEKPILWGPSRHTAGHNIATYHHDPEKNLIELYIDMDQYIEPLKSFDPRPWHEELPLKPRVWEDNCAWYTKYEDSILDLVLRKLKAEPV